MDSAETAVSLRQTLRSMGKVLREGLQDAVEEMQFLLKDIGRSLWGRFRSLQSNLRETKERGPCKFSLSCWRARGAAYARYGAALALFPVAYAVAVVILLVCYAAAALLFFLFMIPMALRTRQ
ncbi:MAG: hypothetical protein OXU43_01940 [Gammaproteobacteria bacterium]|nr:hypothetical protein [Gammaproteobacteria bacterium]